MINLQAIGELIRTRRVALGLSQAQLANLAKLSRTTINLLENGSLNDLGVVKTMQIMDLLGLEFQASQSHETTNGKALRMASTSASVSYKEKLRWQELCKALASGVIPPKRLPHIGTILDELPQKVLVAAVEEAAHLSQVQAKKIWSHVYQWATEFQSPRLHGH
jgi:transcriptional regulator with XRE-family HTH domain